MLLRLRMSAYAYAYVLVKTSLYGTVQNSDEVNQKRPLIIFV